MIEIKGFTPVLDVLVKEYDKNTAFVFGMIQRFCQMEKGLCFATHETIAKRCGLSRPTVHKHIHLLIDGGYLEDVAEKSAPVRVYRDTGKARISLEGGVKKFDRNGKETLQQPVKKFDRSGKETLHIRKDKKQGKKQKEKIKDEPPEYRIFVDLWKIYFPEKPAPRYTNEKLQKKIATRLKLPDFKNGWQSTLVLHSQNKGLQSSGWFVAGFFLESDNNFEKISTGYYNWLDKGFERRMNAQTQTTQAKANGATSTAESKAYVEKLRAKQNGSANA